MLRYFELGQSNVLRPALGGARLSTGVPAGKESSEVRGPVSYSGRSLLSDEDDRSIELSESVAPSAARIRF